MLHAIKRMEHTHMGAHACLHHLARGFATDLLHLRAAELGDLVEVAAVFGLIARLGDAVVEFEGLEADRGLEYLVVERQGIRRGGGVATNCPFSLFTFLGGLLGMQGRHCIAV